MKPKSHPSFFPSPTPSPCPPPNKRKICLTSLANWHCCNYIQILSHTKATHITKEKKKTPRFQVNYFLLEKKNTKHTHFLEAFFFQSVGDVISHFQRQFNCGIFCLFFVGFFVLFLYFFFFLTSKHLCRHHKLWR